MMRLQRYGFLLVVILVHCSRIECQFQHSDRRIKGENKANAGENKASTGENKVSAGAEESKVSATTTDKKKETLDTQEAITNSVCGTGVAVAIGQVIKGNNDVETVDQSIAKECAAVTLPGAWYSINGTGEVLRVNVAEGNYTRVLVFEGNDCTAISCADAISPTITTTHSQESSFWTTFWATEVGVTYHLFLYGSGTFELTLAEEKRPDNDRPNGAIDLNLGDAMEGSITYASPEMILPCGRYDRIVTSFHIVLVFSSRDSNFGYHPLIARQTSQVAVFGFLSLEQVFHFRPASERLPRARFHKSRFMTRN